MHRNFVVLLTFLCLLLSWHLPTYCDDDTETESGDAAVAPVAPVGASDEGELAMSSFKKPKGWKVSLFAAEPELANPVALTVDNLGRLFVCESFRQGRGVTDNRKHDNEWLLADLSAESVQDRIDYHLRLLGTEAAEYTAHDDRIRMLLDTDNDGVADKATVFAEGFNKLEEGTGAGVLARGNKVYFTCIPKLWALTDEDGDGKADSREALQDGYGVRVAFRGHDSHGLIIGPDGRLYFSIGDRGYNIETPDGELKNCESGAVFRCELDGSKLEVFATGLRNPQELAFDDYGYLFTGDNNSDSGDKARWVNVMQGGDTGWRMMYQYLPDRGPFNREKIWYPYSPETTPAYTVPPIENIGDGPSGVVCYPGTGLTGDFANCFFMVDFRGGPSNSGVRLIRSQPKGAFWEIERSEQPLWNILATDIDFGPDGRMWVCDWVFGWVGEGKGRIYRFEDPVAQEQDVVREVESLLGAGFEGLPNERLGELLRHPDRRIRLESQWELANRADLVEFTKLLSDEGAGTIPRLHAVWGAGHAARIHEQAVEPTRALLEAALADKDLDVRASAAKVVGDLGLDTFASNIIALIGDSEPRVQYAACLSAGQLKLADALEPAVTMLASNQNEDPGLRHAGIMALAGMSPRLITSVATHTSPAVRLAAVVALRKLQNPEITKFLADGDASVVLETARAIHDVVELHEGLSHLAALELPAAASDALVHRVLNANFRLGGREAAMRIAAFAADPMRSDAMRVEAVQMLGEWAEPGKLDRVMNRYLPIEQRDASDATDALAANFDRMLSGSSDLTAATLESSVQLQIPGISKRLQEYALAVEKPASLRAQALKGLVRLDGKEAQAMLSKIVNDKNVLVRSTALSELSKLDPQAALPVLKKAVLSDEVSEAQAAWDTLAATKSEDVLDTIESATKKYVSGEMESAVWLNFLEAVELVGDDSQKSVLNSLKEKLAAADSLESYRECQTGGEVSVGKKLFFEKTELSCVRCHKVGETGGEVGPDLTEIAKTKDSRYLLEAIVNPDAKIAEKYETIVLLTDSDQIITGILRSESDTEIELINAEGEIVTVDPDEVLSRKKGKSAMPADLINSMSRRELRDLVAYLSSLK